jgi:hypothetical protein
MASTAPSWLTDYPPLPTFVALRARVEITGEPERSPSEDDDFYPDVDWVSYGCMGGGHVPDDYEWTSNPKEEQDAASIGS